MTDSYDQTKQLRVGRTELRAYMRPWGRTVELAMWHGNAETLYAAQSVQMVAVTREQRDNEAQPFMRLGAEQAQQLMDELWRCGIRPAEGAGSVGQLGATERHLADMRTIALDALNITSKAKP
jgi:hypothetical protein